MPNADGIPKTRHSAIYMCVKEKKIVHTIFISRRHQSGKRCVPCSPFWMLDVVTSSVCRPHRQPRIAFKTLCHRALGIRCYSIIKCISKVLLLYYSNNDYKLNSETFSNRKTISSSWKLIKKVYIHILTLFFA